jgi:hypothetical protein
MLDRPAQNDLLVGTAHPTKDLSNNSEVRKASIAIESNKGNAGFGSAHPTLCDLLESTLFIALH